MISNRIKATANFIAPAKRIADVGCDHGYLIIEAFLNHDITYAIAIDNKEGPLTTAKNNILRYPFAAKVRFSLSDGLQDLTEEVDAIILAGMGGLNALNIITSGVRNIKGARLIIQANRNLYELRKGLVEEGFIITRETITKESNYYYEIIEFQKSTNIIKYRDKELKYGPCLLKEKSILFQEMLKRKLHQYQQILIKNSNVKKNIKEIEEILC